MGEPTVYPSTPEKYDGWWVISDHHFLEAMTRAAAGDDPDLLFAEYYANAYTTDQEGQS